MGGIFSYSWTSPRKINDVDSVTGLTSKEKNYVIKIWSDVKKNPSPFANRILLNYFERHPDYLDYFPFKETPLKHLSNNVKFQDHGLNVINAITAIIDNINNKNELEKILLQNGQSHAKRKIPEKAYWHLKMVILDVIKENVKHKQIDEIIVSWNKLLDVAFKIIIKGLNEQGSQFNSM